jgi:DUF2917 family protein
MAFGWKAQRTGSGTRVWQLARDATLRLPPARGGILVRAERGTVLVTQAGDPEDHVLGAGEEVRLPPGGLAVAWALTPSVLAVRDALSELAADGRVCESCS